MDLLILFQPLLAEAGAPSATPKGAATLLQQPKRRLRPEHGLTSKCKLYCCGGGLLVQRALGTGAKPTLKTHRPHQHRLDSTAVRMKHSLPFH